MLNNTSNRKPIDLLEIWKNLWGHKKHYAIIIPVVFVLSCLLILCVPRYYICNVKLAPELTSSSMSSVSSLAASFGVDFANRLSANQDAISPELYPDLMESTDFRVSLFSLPVQSKDGKIKTNYYTYLAKYQKAPWWSKVLMQIVALLSKKETSAYNGTDKVNTFMLTKPQTDIAGAIGGNIACSVDKKTGVINLSTKAQDPLIAATLADSVSQRLQIFITNYRTKKARNDYEHTLTLYNEAHKQYEKARQTYAAYADANSDVVLNSYRLKAEDLENEMQLKYNIYSSLTTQLQSARAKVQERTPAFTILQSPTVPIRPAGPKRVIFVLAMCALAFTFTSIYFIVSSTKK